MTSPVAALVRVGVRLGRLAVGRPARVAEAGRALRGRAVAQDLLEPPDLADFADDGHVAAIEHGDAGRVIAAVLEVA